MPSNDLVLNVRQIGNYPNLGVQAADTVIFQRGGLGGPYLSSMVDQLVSNALLYNTLPLQLGVSAPSNSDGGQVYAFAFSTAVGGRWLWNSYLPQGGGPISRLGTGPGGKLEFDATGWAFTYDYGGPAGSESDWADDALTVTPTGYVTVRDQVLLNRDPSAPLEAATSQWVMNNTVTSINGQKGAIALTAFDVLGAAPIYSPRFEGQPRAPTPGPGSCSTRIANTAFVRQMVDSAVFRAFASVMRQIPLFAMDPLAVATLNVLPPLSQTPNMNLFFLVVDGRPFFPVGTPPDFSVDGQTVTWLNTVYSLVPGATVVAVYTYYC